MENDSVVICDACFATFRAPKSKIGREACCPRCSNVFSLSPAPDGTIASETLHEHFILASNLPEIQKPTTPVLQVSEENLSLMPAVPGNHAQLSVPPVMDTPAPETKRSGVKTACVLVCLVALGGIAFFLLHHPDQKAASKTFFDSEEIIWSLEGQAISDATSVLAASNASGSDGDDLESAYRAELSQKYSSESRRLAERFIGILDSETRKTLNELAQRQNVKPEEFVLEYITYDACLDLGMMQRIWNQKGSFKGDGKANLESLLRNMTEAPTAEHGIKILLCNDRKISLTLFGATVVEEIAAEKQPAADGNTLTLFWKSNYGYLRSVVNGETPEPIISESLTLENGQYKVNYTKEFEEYVTIGSRQKWASIVHDNDYAKLDTRTNPNASIPLADKGGQQKSHSLQDNFATVAPSVALVEAIGKASGSGFLLEDSGRLIVATNRHVVQGAANGVSLTFFKGDGNEKCSIGPDTAKVIAIHKIADAALIDVTGARSLLSKWGIQPLTLVPSRDYVKVGEHVFAVGYPGVPVSGERLTRTLTDGIVSATGRVDENCRFIQMTAAINPGNSGGPLFDDDSQVVGINTQVYRKSRDGHTLESLNFALETDYLRELLTDRNASLSQDAIADILHPQTAPTLRTDRYETAIHELISKGYALYASRSTTQASIDASTRTLALRPHEAQSSYNMRGQSAHEYAILGFGVDQLNLAVASPTGTVIGSTNSASSVPVLEFRVPETSNYYIAVINESNSDVIAAFMVWEKIDTSGSASSNGNASNTSTVDLSSQIETAKAELADLNAQFDKATRETKRVEKKLASANTDLESAKNAVVSTQAEVTADQNNVNAANNAVNSARNSMDLSQANHRLKDANWRLSIAQGHLTTARDVLAKKEAAWAQTNSDCNAARAESDKLSHSVKFKTAQLEQLQRAAGR